jgi:hypothetical protein
MLYKHDKLAWFVFASENGSSLIFVLKSLYTKMILGSIIDIRF